MESFVKGKNNLKNISYKFFVIISFALLQSTYFNLLGSFQIIVFSTMFTQIPLNLYKEVSPFMEFSVYGKKSLKIFPRSCASLFHLHCYTQTTSISYVHIKSLYF